MNLASPITPYGLKVCVFLMPLENVVLRLAAKIIFNGMI
jgi:hypothetical protein